MISLKKLLQMAVETNSSDLHLQEGSVPALRKRGEIQFLDMPPLTAEQIDKMLLPLLSEEEYDTFISQGDVDFSYNEEGLARFRVSALNHYRGRGAVFRIVPQDIPTLEELNLPPVISKMADLDKGMVLVTGPTGSGKSTTLAAMVDHINHTRSAHIITVEDPIEFVHPTINSYIEQRELGVHCLTFADALRAALRESPDVVLVGEMRELETIRQALRAAETGHLVFATLHTNSAAQTISRIVEVFPADEQPQIRSVLAGVLRGVICQQLVPAKNGGRVAACEIMLVNNSISGIIREGKISQVRTFLTMGRAEGMQTLDLHLAQLIHNNTVSLDDVQEYATDPDVLMRHHEFFRT